MEYISKQLNNVLSVTGIVNLHYFEFDNYFTTVNERHPFYELVFVNSGELQIFSEDYNGVLLKNQAIIHRQNSMYSLKCDSEIQPTVIIIGFECDAKAIDSFSHMPITLGDGAIRKLAEIVKEGRNVFAPPYDIPTYNMKKKKRIRYGSEQMLRILLEYFLIFLVREYGHGEIERESGEAPAPIQEIIRYIDANYLEKSTIDELAFLFKTNRATLCKEFKRVTGKTVVEYVNEKRLEKAKDKIVNSNDSFTKIADDMGFESIHYFTRFFKKLSGETPSAYRKARK